jgi:AP-4 complex subunit sigma-1
MIKFILMVNKQGQTRLAQYYEFLTVKQRVSLEGELIRRCLSRNDNHCSFLEYRNYKVIYRRYASLYFIMGVDNEAEDNEMAYLEFIHSLVETLDKYFENVCELDIMFNIEKAHFILDEMIANGNIAEMNRTNILQPLILMDKFADNK